MTTSSGTQQQQQQSQTVSQPWQPAIPLLKQQLGSIGGIDTTPTGNQQNAAGALVGAAGTIPNLAPLAQGSAGGLLSGMPNVNNFLGSNYDTAAGALGGNYGAASNFLAGNYNDVHRLLGSNYNTLAQNLNPFLQPGFADPTKNPQLAQVLSTIQQDVTNNVNGQFAGAGRDLSPANSQALARGLAQGEAVPFLDEYNQLLGMRQNAAGALSNAGLNTAQTLGSVGGNVGSTIGQLGLGSAGVLGGLGVNTGAGYDKNAVAGLGSAQAIPGLTLAGPQASLAAANAQYGLPLTNIAGQLGLTLPIAGLGGQVNSQGSSTTNSSYTPSLMSSIMAPFQGGSSSAFMGATGGGGINNMLPFLMFGL